MTAVLPHAVSPRAETGPYELVLEFLRTQRPENPYGFYLEDQAYQLRVGGGVFKSAIFPWSTGVREDLEALGGAKPDAEAARRLGEQMRGFLDVLDWGGHEHTLERERGKGEELRLVVRSAAAELYALPWELVTLAGSGRHLADVPGCTLRYEWPREGAEEARTGAAREGRVLFAWSEAGGGVPEDGHLLGLLKASYEGGFDFDARRDVLPRVSLPELEKRLKQAQEAGEPVSVLHVLCHGAPLETSEEGLYGLAWNAPGEGGDKVLVDGGALGAVLAPYADTLRMVVLCACHGGDGGKLASHLGSVAQALHRAGIDVVVASRLPLSTKGSVLLAETLYEKLLVESCSLEEALGAVRRRLRMETKGFDWASLQLYARREGEADLRPVVLRPYRGLLAFGPKDRRFFFGRSKLEAELLERVGQAVSGKRPRFQVVAGASGSGKSSVVMAGLVPRLPREEWDVVVVKPSELLRASGPPVEAERFTVLRELRHRLHRVQSPEPLPDSEGASRQELVEEVWRLRQERPERKLLLVVDQLEEVFTQLGDEERQALMRTLWALGRQPELGCVVVATVRVDHFERCGEVVLDEQTRLDRIVYSEEHRLFVAQLGPEELVEAIERPARRVGLGLEAGLVDRLCKDVGQEPGALPLLAHALDLLWRRREGRWLTHQAYEEMGGVGGALTQTAERMYDALAEAEREQVRRLLAELVAIGEGTTPDSRRRVWLEQVRPEEAKARAAFDRVLERLVAERLVTRGREAGAAGKGWLEVAHESLIRRWTRLDKWLEDNRKRLLQWRELQAMAEDWQEHRRDADGGASYLVKGTRLGYARSIQSEHMGQMTASVREFLEACEARERRRVRRQCGLGAGLVATKVVFALLALYASSQRDMAEQRLQEAVSLARHIHSITSKELEPLPGTAAVRKKLLQGVEGLLQRLHATDEPDIQLESIRNHLERGDVAMQHENMASASEAFNQALSLAEQLLVSNPAEPAYKEQLAIIHSRLGWVCATRGQLHAARDHYQKALELAQQLAEADPANASLKRNLAAFHDNLGEVVQAQGLLVDARHHHEKALELAQELLEAGAEDDLLKRNLAVSHINLGGVAEAQGLLVDARGHYESATAQLQKLSQAEPMNVPLKQWLAAGYVRLGDVAKAQGLLKDARRYYESHLRLSQELLEADPSNALLKQALSVGHYRLGVVMLKQGQLQEASEHLQGTLALSQALLDVDPKSIQVKRLLAETCNLLGALAQVQEREEDASEYYKEAFRLSQELAELAEVDSTNADSKDALVMRYSSLGDKARLRGQFAEAHGYYEKAYALSKELAEADSTNAEWKYMLADSYFNLGQSTQAQGLLAEAQEHYVNSLLLSRELAEADPTDAVVKQHLGDCYSKVAEVEQALGQLEDAHEHHEVAIGLFQALADANPTDKVLELKLVFSYWTLGRVARAQGHLEEAQLLHEEALARLRAAKVHESALTFFSELPIVSPSDR